MNRFFEYAANHPFLLAVTALAALLAIVLEVRHRARGSATVGPSLAVQLANQGALVLDVRTDDQYAAGHIIDARHIASADLEGSLDSLRKYKEKPVIVVCETGFTSAAAARLLKARGFGKVVNLKGGLAAWRQENLPLVKETAKGSRKAEKGARPA